MGPAGKHRNCVHWLVPGCGRHRLVRRSKGRDTRTFGKKSLAIHGHERIEFHRQSRRQHPSLLGQHALRQPQPGRERAELPGNFQYSRRRRRHHAGVQRAQHPDGAGRQGRYARQHRPERLHEPRERAGDGASGRHHRGRGAQRGRQRGGPQLRWSDGLRRSHQVPAGPLHRRQGRPAAGERLGLQHDRGRRRRHPVSRQPVRLRHRRQRPHLLRRRRARLGLEHG